jgi:hypothetical protein
LPFTSKAKQEMLRQLETIKDKLHPKPIRDEGDSRGHFAGRSARVTVENRKILDTTPIIKLTEVLLNDLAISERTVMERLD